MATDATPLESDLTSVEPRSNEETVTTYHRGPEDCGSVVPMVPVHLSGVVAPKLVFAEFEPRKNAHRTVTSSKPTQIDIRQLSVSARKTLLQGPLVYLMVSGYQIGTIPLSLLSATARRLPELLCAHTISLPADTDCNGVVALVQHLIDICRSKIPKPGRLRNDMPVHQSLAVCQAAYRLGLNRYTCHIFQKMEAYISNTVLSYEEMDTIWRFGASHPRLYNRMIDILAVRMREKTIPDPQMFAQYCLARPELNFSIAATMAWFTEQQVQAQRQHEAVASFKQQQERREQDRVQCEQARLRWVKEQVHLNEQAAKHKKHDSERQAREKKVAAHNSTMRQACLAKMCVAGKDRVMTAEEKEWYVKAYRKQPPRGC